MRKLKKLLKSKTVWAGILGTAAWVLEQPAITPLVVVQAASMLLGVAGVRDAWDKATGGRTL